MAATATLQNSQTFWSKLILTLKMVKIQHSIFALPFALSSCLIAMKGLPSTISIIFIILAMITARNTAMSFNRIVDCDFDKLNPRTEGRELPSGLLSLKYAKHFCAVNAILFILFSLYFNILTFILSPIALIIITGYSWTKRFTFYTQLFLGLALGISPIAAWIAMKGEVATFPILLGLGVFFWVSGFDLIYTTLDYNHDKKNGLRNLVVKMGISGSLLFAKLLHLLSIGSLILAGTFEQLGLFYYIGCTLIALLLLYEHSLVKADDLSKVNMAFFTMNGYISILYLVFVGLDICLP